MKPGEMERALRECLRHRAAEQPPPHQSLADRAIRRGRTVRRTRAGAGALALTLVAAGAGNWLLRGGSPGTPEPAPIAADGPVSTTAAAPLAATVTPGLPDAAVPFPEDVRRKLMYDRTLPVDVVVADRLVTSGGESMDLSAVGRVSAAYRLADGWLVLGGAQAEDGTLWYVVDGADPRPLLKAADAITVAPGGDRVAWRAGARVFVGALSKGRLTRTDDTPAPAGAVPAAFVGEGLLLARRPAEALTGTYAVWWPGEGELSARWRVATGVYGSLPDGRTVVAQVPGAGKGKPCLVLLDALAQLTVLAQACEVPLTAGATGWVSPDGRWLVAERTAAESVLVDIGSVFAGRKPAVGAGPRPNGPGAWTDGSTVVYGGSGYLARLRLDALAAGKPDAVERIEVGANDEPVLAVPQLPAE